MKDIKTAAAHGFSQGAISQIAGGRFKDGFAGGFKIMRTKIMGTKIIRVRV